jgi:hypothetical protein
MLKFPKTLFDLASFWPRYSVILLNPEHRLARRALILVNAICILVPAGLKPAPVNLLFSRWIPGHDTD